MTKYEELTVSLSQLLLDPNNYRLDTKPGRTIVPDDKVEEAQDNTQKLLGGERLQELKESIEENGFLPMDRIVVRELSYKTKPKKYVVIEGNRRTAALKSLAADDASGIIKLRPQLKRQIGSLSVLCLRGTVEEIEATAASIMGIRHVSGPKGWTGFQSAKLINTMYNEGNGLSFTQIGKALGISSHDAARRFRGFKAYQQMSADKTYGPKIKRNCYTLLLEFLAGHGGGKTWLGWKDSEWKFTEKNRLERCYRAIVADENGEVEISNTGQARDFIRHLRHPRHEEMIMNGAKLNELPPIPEFIKVLTELKKTLAFLESLEKANLEQDSLNLLVEIGQVVDELIQGAE
jgi:hypothetical protein